MDASTLTFIIKLGALLGKGPCIPVSHQVMFRHISSCLVISYPILSGQILLFVDVRWSQFPEALSTCLAPGPATSKQLQRQLGPGDDGSVTDQQPHHHLHLPLVRLLKQSSGEVIVMVQIHDQVY